MTKPKIHEGDEAQQRRVLLSNAKYKEPAAQYDQCTHSKIAVVKSFLSFASCFTMPASAIRCSSFLAGPNVAPGPASENTMTSSVAKLNMSSVDFGMALPGARASSWPSPARAQTLSSDSCATKVDQAKPMPQTVEQGDRVSLTVVSRSNALEIEARADQHFPGNGWSPHITTQRRRQHQLVKEAFAITFRDPQLGVRAQLDRRESRRGRQPTRRRRWRACVRYARPMPHLALSLAPVFQLGRQSRRRVRCRASRLYRNEGDAP